MYDSYLLFICMRRQSDDCIPDIAWCRDPFLEQLNYIEAFNDIKN